MKLRIHLLFPAGFLLLFATVVIAQTKAPIPTLTTDDVVGIKLTNPVPPATTKDESKSPADKVAVKDATSATPVKTAEDPKQKAEKDWNERLKNAQEKLNALERRADQAELQIAQLRNQLFSAAARSPETNGQLNVRIGELSGLRNRLRAAAQTAQQEVSRLQSEGQENTYQVATVSLTNEKGAPDVQAYQAEQDKLQSELQDAQTRIEVLQIRLNSLQSEVLKKGNGDNFTLKRLQQERDRAASELEETRTRVEELKGNVQSHRQKATAAGISLK